MFQNIIFIRYFGMTHYENVFEEMRDFTTQRNKFTPDEIWLVEHFPVFTKGQKTGEKDNLLTPSDIPIVQSDRGGGVTYHGPGQQIMYVLFDLKRRKLSVFKLITLLERAVISLLAEFGVNSYSRIDAPGVYVREMKICSLGLRIRNGCSFHGLALNVAMDLSPFLHINPCGYAGMKMTHMLHWVENATTSIIYPRLVKQFLRLLQNPSYKYI